MSESTITTLDQLKFTLKWGPEHDIFQYDDEELLAFCDIPMSEMVKYLDDGEWRGYIANFRVTHKDITREDALALLPTKPQGDR